MHGLKLALWIFIITIIETLFGAYIKIGSVMPDLLFVFSMCYAARAEKINGVIIVSVLCGALKDCFSGRIFGNYLVIFLLCAVLLWIVRDIMFKKNILLLFSLIFLFFVLGKSLFFVANIGILKGTGYLYSLFAIILPEALYNISVAFAVYPLTKMTLKKRSSFYR